MNLFHFPPTLWMKIKNEDEIQLSCVAKSNPAERVTFDWIRTSGNHSQYLTNEFKKACLKSFLIPLVKYWD